MLFLLTLRHLGVIVGLILTASRILAAFGLAWCHLLILHACGVDVPLCIVEYETWSLPVNQHQDRAVTPEVKFFEMTFALS